MSVSLPDDLIPVDSLLVRWGRSTQVVEGGGMHPLERMRLMHDGAVLGGGGGSDDWLYVIDAEVSHAPGDVRSLVVVWYCHARLPLGVKMQRLGYSKTTIYVKRNESLRYMQGALRGKLSRMMGEPLQRSPA